MVISDEELYHLVSLSNIGGYLIIYSAHQGQVIKFNEFSQAVGLEVSCIWFTWRRKMVIVVG